MQGSQQGRHRRGAETTFGRFRELGPRKEPFFQRGNSSNYPAGRNPNLPGFSGPSSGLGPSGIPGYPNFRALFPVIGETFNPFHSFPKTRGRKHFPGFFPFGAALEHPLDWKRGSWFRSLVNPGSFLGQVFQGKNPGPFPPGKPGLMGVSTGHLFFVNPGFKTPGEPPLEEKQGHPIRFQFSQFPVQGARNLLPRETVYWGFKIGPFPRGTRN